MKALHVDSQTKSPTKISIYSQPTGNLLGLNKIFSKRKGSISRHDMQLSDFYAQGMLNETKINGNTSMRKMSLRRETKESDLAQSDKILGMYTKNKLVEGFEDQKSFQRIANKKPYETLKFRASEGYVMGKVPRKSNCVRDALRKTQNINSSLLSQDDMTQSNIIIDDRDKRSPRKMVTDNRDVRKKDPAKQKSHVSINNLLQFIKSDRKLTENRKLIEVC